jgi:hypothetical protein
MDVSALAQLFNTLNEILNVFFLVLFLGGIVIWNSRELVLSARKEIKKNIKEVKKKLEDQDADLQDNIGEPSPTLDDPRLWLSGVGRAVYLWLISVAIQIAAVLLFWFTPSTRWVSAETLRWIELYIVLSLIVYSMTKRYGGRRGLYSAIGHLSVLWFSWTMGRWFGVFFVFIPLVSLYYYVLYRIAEVIIPASDPDDPKEKIERFKILVWYMWGMQYPIIVVANRTGTKVETRIESSPSQDYGAPGYIWAAVHQVIGLTNGTRFSRVEGPGAIYTQTYERLMEVVDLRTQLRTTQVETITQDGVPIRAIVFAAFGIDREIWDSELYRQLRVANPMLRGGRVPDHGSGNYRFSRSRVRAALSMAGVRTNASGGTDLSSLRWDEQVMYIIEETTRCVLSEVPFSELWLPSSQRDERRVSALDLLADEMKGRLSFNLLENGVSIFAARVVNYALLTDTDEGIDEITQQQVSVWQTRWEQRAVQKIAMAKAGADQKLLDTTALARSMLIASIAESLQQSRTSNLPRYLIAMRFLGALDDLLSQQPTLAAGEEGRLLRERLTLLKNNLPVWKL